LQCDSSFKVDLKNKNFTLSEIMDDDSKLTNSKSINSELVNSKSTDLKTANLGDIDYKKMNLKPIGIISSPFKETFQAPRQGRYRAKISQITIFNEYKEALDGIEKFNHLIILYWLDRAERNLLKVIPPGKTKKRGVFSTRAPTRPNPIALSIVEIIEINNDKKSIILTVKGLDALDGSLVVDIKPYSKELDCVD
jgi:tRNA-Thr(GGU) m(6)t(6)A37 methyltransferase TsaA